MRIIIVEDNQILANAIAYRLRDLGHGVDVIYCGEMASLFLERESADLLILDINLPKVSGLEIVSTLRSRGESVPVILLTARESVQDRIQGLDAGADDYLIKPFEMDELEARIRALLRRKHNKYEENEKFGDLLFNISSRQLYSNNQLLELPRRELSVFECLLKHKNRIVSKETLFEFVYGIGNDIDEASIEPHVSRLRKRLQNKGVKIKTARGLGYMIEEET